AVFPDDPFFADLRTSQAFADEGQRLRRRFPLGGTELPSVKQRLQASFGNSQPARPSLRTADDQKFALPAASHGEARFADRADAAAGSAGGPPQAFLSAPAAATVKGPAPYGSPEPPANKRLNPLRPRQAEKPSPFRDARSRPGALFLRNMRSLLHALSRREMRSCQEAPFCRDAWSRLHEP